MAYKETKRKGFNFYRSYFDVFNALENDADKLKFIECLLERQFLGKKPEGLKGMVEFAWISQVNSIDAQVKGYEDKTKTKLPLTTPPWQGGKTTLTAPPYQQEKEKEKEKEKEQQQEKGKNENFVDVDVFFKPKDWDDFGNRLIGDRQQQEYLVRNNRKLANADEKFVTILEKFIVDQKVRRTIFNNYKEGCIHFNNWISKTTKFKTRGPI